MVGLIFMQSIPVRNNGLSGSKFREEKCKSHGDDLVFEDMQLEFLWKFMKER